MGRKIKFDKNCGSKFITIDDEKKWELIREIATVKRYESRRGYRSLCPFSRRPT